MKNRYISLLLLLVSGFFLTSLMQSCKSRATEIDPEFARYINAFTYGKLAPDGFIQVELAQEMPAVELNTELQEQLFAFSPRVKGKTSWINATTLRFVPDSGALKPGKSYKASLNLGKLMQVEKKFRKFNFDFHVSEQSFTLSALPFSPVSATDLEWNAIEIDIRLANATSAEQIKKSLEIQKSNKECSVKVAELNPTLFRVRIDSLKREKQAKTYAVSFNASLLGVKKEEKFDITIPALSTNNFEVFDVRLQQENDPFIRVTFTDPVSLTQDLTGLISSPDISNYTYQIDRNVVKIYPETLPEKTINLNINGGIKSLAQLALDKNYSFSLNVESTKPEIAFEKSGNILPNSDKLILPFKAVNLWAVDVKVIKVYQNNVLYFLQSNSLNDNSQNELRRFGRLIKKVQIRLDEDKSLDLGKWNNFSLDLAPIIKKDPGAWYVVQLSMKQDYSLYRCGGLAPVTPQTLQSKKMSDALISEEDENEWDNPYSDYYEAYDWTDYNWSEHDDPCKPSYFIGDDRTAKAIVMASNVGIIAKSSTNGVLAIAATDILSTNPIAGATVKAYNYQMQEIGKAKTDNDGFAEIQFSKSKPFVVTVAKDKEIGYLEVKDESSLSLSNFDVSGKEIQKGLKGYLYTERGVWRPGDTIHLGFILEDKNKKLPKGHPIVLEVFTPTRQFYNRIINVDGQNGFYTFAIPISTSAPTGVWQASIKVGGTQFFKSLRVETIKPNRLKIRLDCDTMIDASKAVISGTITAQWLHGALASNLKADAELRLSKSEKPFQSYTNYTFNNPLSDFETTTFNIFDGTLDNAGNASIQAKIPLANLAPGMLRGTILSRVFESGGDMSFYNQTVVFSPFSSYVGIKSPADNPHTFLETDKNITFDIVTLNPYGKKVNRSLEYKIYKMDWSWWWNNQGNNAASYINNTSAQPLASGIVASAAGSAKIHFKVNYPDWGRYLVLAKDPESGHTTGLIFYVDWPSWRGRSNKTDPSGLTMLSFATDKPSYLLGESATVIIPKSSKGRVLISIENGTGIIKREWVATSATSDTKYSFKITDEMSPNCYVFASLLQPHSQQENDLPIRMYGVVNVNIENKASKLEPTIQMPTELRPEKEFTISVSEKTKKPMTYTLAIVDEGLLDITSFKTPNAWNEFYAREALGVRTWDLFDRVLGTNSGIFGPLLSIGGDEALKATSDKVNRFKPVVKFLGPYSINAGEMKSHKLKLPAYIGSVRVMVVAGGGGAYGSTEKTVTVHNPIMTLTTLPRVMGPNEELFLPVNVFSSDKKIKSVRVNIQTKALLIPVDGSSQTVYFDKPGDKIVYFKLKSGMKIGEEKLIVSSTANNERFVETISIGIRNPNPPVILSQTTLVEPGKHSLLNLKLENISPNDWVKMEISRLPSINLNKNLSFLSDYQHACTEQLTSIAFPLLYVDQLIKMNDEEKAQNNKRVDQLIRRVLSRQLPDGGFAYWDGDNYASEWASSYSGHFLLEAIKKGYAVPDNAIKNWTRFQQKLARNWTPTVSLSQNQFFEHQMTDLQQGYRLYTLALAEKPELGAMNRLREIKNPSKQAKFQLASAYALAGRKSEAKALIFNINPNIEAYNFNNDTYGSPLRDQALIMDTYMLLGMTEKAMNLSASVASALSNHQLSTQATAFALIAMEKLALKMGKGNINVNYRVNNQASKSIDTPQPMVQTSIVATNNITVDIQNRGTAKIYARLTARTQAINPISKPNDASFIVRVKYQDKNGKPVDIRSMKQGEEFEAKIIVKNSEEQSFSNIALLFIVPSGWEIINERLMETNDDANTILYNRKDIRDDRVLNYFNLNSGNEAKFNVKLRAAYRGRYYAPPISCQALYAPTENATTSGIWVEVK